jgi:hypothetical protein
MNEAGAPAPDDDESGTPPRGKFDAKLLSLRRRAFRFAPWLFPDPSLPEILDYHRRTDPQRDAENRLPDDEKIGLHAIWALEYYTPAHVGALLNGLTRLGWDKSRHGSVDRNAVEWVRALRDHETGGSWLNLGVIYRPDQKGLFGLSRVAPLPDSFDYAFGQIVSLTPSITCVMIAFVPRDEVVQSFERNLRREYVTTVDRRGTSYAIIDPYFGRCKAIRDLRQRLRLEAADWFKEHLPGVFSSGHLGNELPTCELMSLTNAAPFPVRNPGDPKPAPYLGQLGVSDDLDVWQSTSLQGLYFKWPLRSDDDPKYHGVLVAQRAVLERPSLYDQSGTTEDSFPQVVNDHAQHMLQLWGVLALLTGYQNAISRARDSDILGSSKLPSVSILSSLASLSNASRDVVPMAAELCQNGDRPPVWSRFAQDFAPVNDSFNGSEGLTERLVHRIHERAAQMGQFDRTVRELITQRSAIVSAYENVRIQQHIRWLTIIIFVLTAAAVLFAAENSPTIKALWATIKE